MKVTVKYYLNVRVGKPSVNAPCYQYIAPGSQIEVDGKLYTGDMFEGIDQWMRDEGDNYYWAGGIQSKSSFSWFKELEIETIWNTYNEKGENACIAILDTGYNTTNNDLIAQDQKLLINYTDAQACNTINDLDGHGTRCMSIAGARNLQQYNIGVAPQSKVLIGKISCQMELRDHNSILEGIKWAIDSGAEIISISFGFVFADSSQQQVFQAALQKIIEGKKVLIFAAAGNNLNSQPAFGDKYPASFPECISVGSTDKGVLSNITIQSNTTVIHAPGIAIESYDVTGRPTPASGTSYSTPIVAGIAALAVSYCKKTNNTWDPAELRNALYNSASPLAGQKKLIQPLEFFKQLNLNYHA